MNTVSAFVFANELIQCGALNVPSDARYFGRDSAVDRDDNDTDFDFGPLSRAEMRDIVEEMMG